jgi:hypothetical protein
MFHIRNVLSFHPENQKISQNNDLKAEIVKPEFLYRAHKGAIGSPSSDMVKIFYSFSHFHSPNKYLGVSCIAHFKCF